MSQQGVASFDSTLTIVQTLTGNSGGAVFPAAGGNIDILGNNATGIDVVGTPSSNLLTVIGIASSDTQRGTVELATNAEAVSGASTSLAVTPANLVSVFASPFPIGSTTPNSASFTQVDIDNININGNTISSTNANGNILLAPNGTGAVTIPSNNLYVGSSAPGNPYNISIEASTAGLIGESIQNTSVAATAGSNLQLIVEPATADAFTLYNVNGAATYSTGIDNSASDSFKITTGSTPSSGTTAVSITTAGIVTLPAGALDVPSGGTGLTTITDHAVLIGSGTGAITPVGPVASTGALLASNGVGSDPGFTTATYPLTTTISEILYSSAANTVTGLATANRGVLTTGATGVPAITALATDGQLIIGSTAGAPAAASLTAGSGITVTPGSNSITIAATATGDVTASANLTDNAVVRGDGGAKGVQTSTVSITDAGEMTNSSQPAFSAYLSASATNATGDNTAYTVAFDSELYDQNADFAANTFTAPVTGIYRFNWIASVSNLAAGHTLMLVSIGGRQVERINPQAVQDSGGFVMLSGSTDLSLTATNTVTMVIQISGSTKTVTVNGTVTAGTFFNGSLIC